MLLLEGDQPENTPFDGIDVSWGRVEGGAAISQALREAQEAFDPMNPTQALPALLEAYQLMEEEQGYWIDVKREDLKQLIAYCGGLYFEANSGDYRVAQGDTLAFSTFAIQRSEFPIVLKELSLGSSQPLNTLNLSLKPGTLHRQQHKLHLPKSTEITQPYWLANAPESGVFHVDRPGINRAA